MKPLDPRLLRYSRSSRGFLITTVAIAIVSAFATIFQALLITNLIVSFFQRHESFSSNRNLVVDLAAIFLVRASLSFITDRVSTAASSKMRSELRNQIMKKTLDSGAVDVQRLGTAGLSVLITKGINSLDGYFAKFLPQLFIATIVPLMVGLTITFRDWKSGLVIICTIPLIPLFGILIGRFTANATAKKWQTLGLLSGYFLDLLSGLTTLKVYGRSKLQGKKLKQVGDDYRSETMKVLKLSFLSSLALELIATLSVALLAVSIGLRLVSGSISLSVGLFILIIAPEVYWPIRQVAGYFHAASDGMTAFEQLFEILDRKDISGGITLSKIEAITWSQLTVDYPDRSTVHIPSGQISAGSVHGLIGASGSGKSTLASILLGFSKPTSGEVLISTDQGTFPLSEIDLSHWQSRISWLPQEPKFPLGSVAAILKHAKPGALEFELVEALSKVDLDISDLPNGLRTELGTINQPLSQGQLRKIALARAILKPADILILDEPTASVDDVSEEIISKLLDEQRANGKLILLITHRNVMIAGASAVTNMARAR